MKEKNKTEINTKDITIVTVTYGDRKKFIEKLIKSVSQEPAERIIIIDNGSEWEINSLKKTYGEFLHIINMGENTGSAIGFSTGIEYAISLGADYIWLLDDDNMPREGTLNKLLDVFTQAIKYTPRNKLATLAFRPEHQADVAVGVPIKRINPRPNSFQWFHIFDIPYKIWRRTPWGRPRLNGKLPSTIPLDMAPYSGLFFHRDMVELTGLPNIDFILYADDIEFTHRIIENGGQILLVPDAIIEDLESSWNIKKSFSNSFVGLLEGNGDFRAYYTMRNTAYFFSSKYKKNNIMFFINLYTYIIILYIFSIVLYKKNRFLLLKGAINDGLSNRLGENKSYPL